jgi:hypothetical protein
MNVKTYNELENWLSENFNFEDANILSIEKSPLKIRIGYNIDGNFKANSKRSIRVFELIPSGIKEWTYDERLFTPSEDHYLECIEPVEILDGVGFEIYTPSIRLVADAIEINEKETIETTFKPWTSETDVFVDTELKEIPRPIFWKERLMEYGHNILYRYYCGEARQPEQLPYPDYTGYYIQLENKIDTTREGIFIQFLTKDDRGIHILFVNKDETLNVVWNDLKNIIGDLPGVIIHSGNCEFTGNEWKQFLKTNK